MQVNAHLYPLTDAAIVCVREANKSSAAPSPPPCIASGAVNQLDSLRDGRWQRALSRVRLEFNRTYEFVMQWDALKGGYVAADALLVESVVLYNGDGGDGVVVEHNNTVVIGPMDSRILTKIKY